MKNASCTSSRLACLGFQPIDGRTRIGQWPDGNLAPLVSRMADIVGLLQLDHHSQNREISLRSCTIFMHDDLLQRIESERTPLSLPSHNYIKKNVIGLIIIRHQTIIWRH